GADQILGELGRLCRSLGRFIVGPDRKHTAGREEESQYHQASRPSDGAVRRELVHDWGSCFWGYWSDLLLHYPSLENLEGLGCDTLQAHVHVHENPVVRANH